MAIAGRVAIVPKGDWSTDATYKRLDAVTHNNTLYFAKKDVPAGTETSNTEYWSKSVVGGEATVDDTISSESTNPVQNKVVKAYVDKKASENVDFSTSTSKLLNDSIEAQLVLSNATRNLLNPTSQTTTQNGVTCTNNGDGTYTVNGTATQDVMLRCSIVVRNIYGGMKLLGTPKGLSEFVRVTVTYSDENKEWANYNADYGNGLIIDGSYPYIEFGIVIGKGETCNNAVFKPMITTDLSATYDDFVPYSGYDIKTCGKNLFKNYDYYGAYKVSTETYNGNSVIYSSDDFKGAYQSDLILKKGKTYAISAYVKGSGTYNVYCDEIGKVGQSINIPGKHEISSEWTKITRVYTPSIDVHKVRIEVFGGSLYISCFQIEEWSQATDYEQYQDGGTVHIDSTTEFPLLGLKSFDGETNIISPGNVEVTYAKSDSGKAILDMSENKLDKDNVVNNQTTTEEGFALDARQANPNVEGTLAKQISDLNGSLKVFFVDLNSETSLENIYNKYAKQQGTMYIGFINYNNKLAYRSNTTYVFMSAWSMVALASNIPEVGSYDTSTKTWLSW